MLVATPNGGATTTTAATTTATATRPQRATTAPRDPASMASLSDSLLCDVLRWLRARDLVATHSVSRRLARCAAAPVVVQAVALRAGLPAIIPLSYLQRDYGWMMLSSVASTLAGGRPREPPVATLRVALLGEPSVGRHSYVHCLLVNNEMWRSFCFLCV
jgi:hypothetical protein